MILKMNNSLKLRIQDLADKVGVRLDWERDPFDTIQWDGNSIACENQNDSNIIHDIAHYALASVRRRKLPDFGLGSGPDSKLRSKSVLSGKNRDKEEELASALGIHWEKKLGLDWEATARYHSWYDFKIKGLQLEEAWNYLEKSKGEYMNLV